MYKDWANHAFGELKQCFRQLYFCELHSFERMVKVISACCVLHNLADSKDSELFEPPEEENAEGDLDDQSRDDDGSNEKWNSL